MSMSVKEISQKVYWFLPINTEKIGYAVHRQCTVDGDESRLI